VSAVEREVLAPLGETGVRAYIVWTPILDGDDRAAARRAARQLGGRAHYWDAGARLGRALGAVLGVPEEEGGVAWDVYLLYDRGRRWRGRPPAPSFWMHQLPGVKNAPRLDPAGLRERLRELLMPPARP
jgi:hypothetical protein